MKPPKSPREIFDESYKKGYERGYGLGERAAKYVHNVAKEAAKPENIAKVIVDVAINSIAGGSTSSGSDYLPPALNGDPQGAFKRFRNH